MLACVRERIPYSRIPYNTFVYTIKRVGNDMETVYL